MGLLDYFTKERASELSPVLISFKRVPAGESYRLEVAADNGFQRSEFFSSKLPQLTRATLLAKILERRGYRIQDHPV
jgi:hypothetical protein